MDTNSQGFHEETGVLSNLSETEWKLVANTTLLGWKGFWLTPHIMKFVISIENQFNPLPSEILLVSFPKTGTTWLKALTATILRHNSNPDSDSQTDPLQTQNPHQLIPFLELETFGESPSRAINQVPSPRVFNTHLPYSILPEAVKNSGCHIIYISRNPADTFVSTRHFYNKRFGTKIPLEVTFDEFCQGTEDPKKHVSRIAEFLGCSLSADEIDQVVWKCSHERLSKLDVNKDEERVHWSGMKFSSYFRRGVVGDGKNLLSPEMMDRIETLANQRWEGSGLENKMFGSEPNLVKSLGIN
ncbi:cytosolic sulfotransferase 5-like [Rhododendron vialii]|uniref:cytosolic sulfotransferase 5-like n=1 Tax=Rhododendron vialii TaxID=182163 RepID=UPI00265E84C6|nr:cytosolic sulfotransferase 5-like [Rhododendron vialii]